MNKFIYLSYFLNEDTPTYGNRNKFIINKQSSIQKGDVANDSKIETTVHIGTHIDMPYHFYENGQTIEDFDLDFFRFKNILFLDFIPKNIIISLDEIKQYLDNKADKKKYDFLLIKTGICHKRNSDEFWKFNYGFDPDIAEYLREFFPNIRVIGFDSISISSFTNRMLGRKAHKEFLNPKKPILILEDIDLTNISKNNNIKFIEVVPLRIKKCDGLPCTVIGEIE